MDVILNMKEAIAGWEKLKHGWDLLFILTSLAAHGRQEWKQEGL